jgi:hypothetical protein
VSDGNQWYGIKFHRKCKLSFRSFVSVHEFITDEKGKGTAQTFSNGYVISRVRRRSYTENAQMLKYSDVTPT